MIFISIKIKNFKFYIYWERFFKKGESYKYHWNGKKYDNNKKQQESDMKKIMGFRSF